MPKPPLPYILICAASGTGLSQGVESLIRRLEERHRVVHRDIESLIVQNHKVQKALHLASPTMRDVVWGLPHESVLGYWEDATGQCLSELGRGPKADTIRILSSHLTYFNGRRREFFAVNSGTLSGSEIRPSHVLLLIDDVYDMFARLTTTGGVFDERKSLETYVFGEDSEELEGPRVWSPSEYAQLTLEWRVETLLQLLKWRFHESLIARQLATSLKARFLPWAVKQPVEPLLRWIENPDARTLYLSHPISKPRRALADNPQAGWPSIVQEFNNIQDLFLRKGIIAIMPTGIDELRIEKESGRKDEGEKQKQPGEQASAGGAFWQRRIRLASLSKRWPLVAPAERLLYNLPAGQGDSEYLTFFDTTRQKDDYEKYVATKKQIQISHIDGALLVPPPIERSQVMSGFERQLELQITARDHLIVAHSDSIFVFRPLFQKPHWSKGVEAEVQHWEQITQSRKESRAAFVHWEEDLRTYAAGNTNDLNASVQSLLMNLTANEFGMSPKQLITDLARSKDEKNMLDFGRLPAGFSHEITEKLREQLPAARRFTLMRILSDSSAEVEDDPLEDKRFIWVCRDMADFQERFDEIVAFLSTGRRPDDRSQEWSNIVWS